MIFHDGLPDERVSAAGREAEAAYNQLGAALKHDLSRSVPIILVRRDGDLPAITTLARHIVPQRSAPDSDRRVVISLESLDRRTGIIVHELTHVFAFEIIPGTSRAAPFLIEGLADHQRGAWPAEDLRVIRAAISRGSIPSVAGLAASDSHWAHAVFDFVAARHGAEGLRRLLFALRKHVTIVAAVPTAFGITLDQFNQEFRGYVATTLAQP